MCVNFSPHHSRLDKVLAGVVRERHVDLVIIEGMGRAIHTNYYAILSCESLKMAVIKNSWLADRLGGKLFSVVFKYEVPPGHKTTTLDDVPVTPS
jgi:type II pantothenate kinase